MPAELVIVASIKIESSVLIDLDVIHISDVINEKWHESASYVPTWSAATCPTLPDENGPW